MARFGSFAPSMRIGAYGDVYLAAYLRVLDDEVRSDTFMFFNSRKSHTFSVIQQLKTIGLLPARAWQQQSTKGALLWPVNWSGAAADEVPAASAASQHQHRCGRHDRLRRRLQHPAPRAAKNVSGAITGKSRCSCTRRVIAAAAKRPRAAVRAARMPSRSGTAEESASAVAAAAAAVVVVTVTVAVAAVAATATQVAGASHLITIT